MFRYYIYVSALFTTISGQNQQEVPNLSVIKGPRNEYNCILVNDSLNSALLWNSTTVATTSTTTVCSLRTNAGCNLHTDQQQHWNWIEYTDLPPVLDYRWESFPIVTLEKKLAEIYKTNGENVRISFSLKMEQEVNVFLCNDYGSYSREYSNCYWISFGAYNGNISYIRKCGEGASIPEPDNYNHKCYYKQEKVPTHDIVKFGPWQHFTVSMKENIIEVRIHNLPEPFLTYTDSNGSVYKPTYVVARKIKTSSAYIKVHKVQTLIMKEKARTATFHFEGNTISAGTPVSLYVKTCKECSFKINGGNNPTTIQSEKSDDWYEIFAIAKESINYGKITLETTIESQNHVENPYWYIGETIRNCDIDIATKKVTFYENGEDHCCYALKYPNYRICTKSFHGELPEDTECPINTIGKNCLSCKKLNYGEYCTQNKICELSSGDQQCSCSVGYAGPECLEPCAKGTYGFGCKRKCGGCEQETCHNINGFCKCDENFEGYTCHTAKLPVLKNDPILIIIGHRNVNIIANMDYEGQQQPTKFDIQYKEVLNRDWISYQQSEYKDGNQSILISRLKSNTQYALRIVLIVGYDQKYDGKHVPEIKFNTTCRNITREFLTTSTSNSSITVFVDINKPLFEEICPLSTYYISLRRSEYPPDPKSFDFQNNFVGLNPYKDYKIVISMRETYDVVLMFTIKTDEGIPSQVVNPRAVGFARTSVTLQWEEPLKQYSKIKEYHIQIKYVRSGACPTHISNFGQPSSSTVPGTSSTIGNLLPYSVYQGTIQAVAKYHGDETPFLVQTESADKPYETEYPASTVIDSKTTYKIIFEWDCNNIRGPLGYQVELICLSEWCFENKTISDVKQVNQYYLKGQQEFNVNGYTNYIVRESLLRNNVKIYKDKPLPTSAPTEPGKVRDLTVYSKNGTSISFRWLPPYPPTGIIENYFIYEWYYTELQQIKGTSTCKLWPKKVCATVNVKSYAYYSISAKNVDVPERGPKITTDSIKLKEEEPQPPLNISFKWNDEYDLTVLWQHPDITNGNLKQFVVDIDGKEEQPYVVEDEEPGYNQTVHISDDQKGNKLNIGILAKNSAGSSKRLGEFTYSPPKKPRFVEDPVIDQDNIGNTSFSITIPVVTNIQGDKSYMYIILTDLKNPVKTQYQHPSEVKLFQSIGVVVDNSWVVGEIKLSDIKDDGLTFEVGNDVQNKSETVSNWKFLNRKLQTGNSYNVSIIINNTFREYVRYNVYTLNCTVKAEPSRTRDYLFALLLIPIALCVICLFYIRRNRDKMNTSIYASLQQLGLARNTNDVPMSPLIPERNPPPQQTPPQTSSSAVVVRPRSKVIMPVEVKPKDNRKYSKPVKILDLDKYIKEAIESGEFDKQHGVFQRGQTKPWTCGALPENKTKNRYSNLAAYDHTRVKLKIINKDPHSDYINANYIDGYKQEKVYIATQGPKASTLNDFWRMIWQEKSENIIMIANLVEAGKKKVEKYWPDINETREFNDIKVEYVSVEVKANYEVRYFNVRCGDEKRKVQQFHFLTWPDHGVPLYAQSLAPFLKRMLTIPQGKAPMVVHCSAGVGRTGSLILCDICLRMAAREGKIDAFYYLYKIRDQRVNMVDNVEQYKLVHLALLQCLVAPETGVPCDETMEKSIETIVTTKIKAEMKYLEDSSWQDEAMRSASFNSDLPIVQAKNRFKNILPDPSSRILLSPYPSSDQTSSYINAVTVDAFLTPAKFIVTQDPLSKTVGDFWRLIDEKQVTMVICLNELNMQDKSTCTFYPTSTEATLKPVPYLEVKCTGQEVNTHYTVYSVTMSQTNDQEDDRHIKIMHLNNWSYDKILPENPLSLLTAYEQMNRLGRTSDSILVTCHDGARASGLFVSMCFVVDKIKMEQICDVCLAVRTVRHSRKEFIREPEQFSFLYKCGLEYVRQFEMYANFSSNKNLK